MYQPFRRTYQLLAIHYILSLTVAFWYFHKKQSIPAIFNRNNNMYKTTLISVVKKCQCAMPLALKVASHATFKHHTDWYWNCCKWKSVSSRHQNMRYCRSWCKIGKNSWSYQDKILRERFLKWLMWSFYTTTCWSYSREIDFYTSW